MKYLKNYDSLYLISTKGERKGNDMPKKKVSSVKALARIKGTLKNQREKNKALETKAIAKGTMIATSVGTAMVEDKIAVDVAGAPTKLLAAGLCYAVAMFTKGTVSKVAESAGDSLVNVYSYKVAMQVRSNANRPLIAGEPPSIEYVMER